MMKCAIVLAYVASPHDSAEGAEVFTFPALDGLTFIVLGSPTDASVVEVVGDVEDLLSRGVPEEAILWAE